MYTAGLISPWAFILRFPVAQTRATPLDSDVLHDKGSVCVDGGTPIGAVSRQMQHEIDCPGIEPREDSAIVIWAKSQEPSESRPNVDGAIGLEAGQRRAR